MATTEKQAITGRQAVARVMADGKPRKAKEITSEAVKLVTNMTGKTPEATLAALLYTEAKKKNGLVVKTRKKGEFKLRPVKAAPAPAAASRAREDES
jgi:ribosomal protein S7